MICGLFLTDSAYAEGEVKNLKDFQYWDSGKVKQCSVYDSSTGRLKAIAFCRHYDGTVDKIERYDTKGRKIEESLYDENGHLKKGIDGWAARRWRYDEYTLRTQISYGENGRAFEKKFYSEGGRLIFRQYREGLDDEVPYEAANMAMMLGSGNFKFPDEDMKVNDPMPIVER